MTVKQCPAPFTDLEAHPDLAGYWIAPDGTLLIDSDGDYVDPEHIYNKYGYGCSSQLFEEYSLMQSRLTHQHQPRHDPQRSSLSQLQCLPRPCLPKLLYSTGECYCLNSGSKKLAEAGNQIAGFEMIRVKICFDDFLQNLAIEAVFDSSEMHAFVKNSKDEVFYDKIEEKHLMKNCPQIK